MSRFDGLRQLARRAKRASEGRRFVGLEWRDRVAGRQLALVQDRMGAIRGSDILLFVCLRNERLRMPAFVDHYRALGVGHFFVVDNGSTDGFDAWAAGQPDMSVWRTEASYRDSAFGMLWLNDLMRRHARGRWCVVVDPDEFLVYPRMETRKLPDLVQFLEDDRRACMHALLVDAYSDRPMSETVLVEGTDPFAVCPFFDRDGYVQTEGWGNGTWIQGGPRLRKHFPDAPHGAPALNKIPLVRWTRTSHFRHSTHDAYPRRLNRSHTQGEVSVTGALFHFKLVSALTAKAEEEAVRGEHYDGGREYAHYRREGAEAEFYTPGISVRYEGSEQLVRLGLMSAGSWF
jgi:glycosyl transferase family 2